MRPFCLCGDLLFGGRFVNCPYGNFKQNALIYAKQLLFVAGRRDVAPYKFEKILNKVRYPMQNNIFSCRGDSRIARDKVLSPYKTARF